MTTELKTPHRDMLTECKLSIDQLKEPLKGEVTALEAEISAQPTDKQINHLKKQKLENLSGRLAHKIKDQAEEGLPEDKPVATTTAPPASTETPPAATTTAPPASTETPPAATTTPEPPATTGGRSFFERHRRS